MPGKHQLLELAALVNQLESKRVVMRGSTRTRKSRHILNADGPMASMQSAQIALSTLSSISQAPAPSSSTATAQFAGNHKLAHPSSVTRSP